MPRGQEPASEIEDVEQTPAGIATLIDRTPSRMELAPRGFATIRSMECTLVSLLQCLNNGAHCTDSGIFVGSYMGSFGSCSNLCHCPSYVYHDELKRKEGAAEPEWSKWYRLWQGY